MNAVSRDGNFPKSALNVKYQYADVPAPNAAPSRRKKIKRCSLLPVMCINAHSNGVANIADV